MRLIGRAKLKAIVPYDEAAAKWIGGWSSELCDAHWKRPTDVTNRFPKVCLQDDGSFLFPVPRSGVGIVVRFRFAQEIALISGVLADEK
jgi:mRNA-degrading endonuclease HigB of HigAB toxin-antitoxin module